MKINTVSDESISLTLNGWVYYIDDSTGEKIVQRWPADDNENSDQEKDNYLCEWVEYGERVPGYFRREEPSVCEI